MVSKGNHPLSCPSKSGYMVKYSNLPFKAGQDCVHKWPRSGASWMPTASRCPKVRSHGVFLSTDWWDTNSYFKLFQGQNSHWPTLLLRQVSRDSPWVYLESENIMFSMRKTYFMGMSCLSVMDPWKSGHEKTLGIQPRRGAWKGENSMKYKLILMRYVNWYVLT